MATHTATNHSTKFTPFSLPLPNNATLTGIAHIPPLTSWTQGSQRPLIVALHGGTCTANHYDISPAYTSSTTSEATGIPIVAINRPCYGGTSTFLPLPDESEGFISMTAEWMHRFILPVLWDTFGVPNQCAGIVLLSHSLAVASSILTAAMYAGEPNATRGYRLAGMVFSGFGALGTENNGPPPPIISQTSDEIVAPREMKRLMMVSGVELGCAEPDMFPLIDAQTVGMPRAEIEGMFLYWPKNWEQVAQQVDVPVLYRMGEHDWLWKGDVESMEQFRVAFTKCPRFDLGVVRGAPHALEMWTGVQQWYDLVFRFAAEACE